MRMQAKIDLTGRVFRAAGQNAYELGLNLGRQLGPRLETYLQQYFDARLSGQVDPNPEQFQKDALEYLSQLPDRFRDELEGLSAGADLPLTRLAEWVYLDPYLESACTGAICLLDGHAWVARNNDIFAPHLWGYATIRELDHRIPTITFGLLGDVFTPTGVNGERLWLHYNFLPVSDDPSIGKQSMPAYAFLVEALETCSSLPDVEKLLDQIDRDGGMMLFAVDGKRDDFAIYDCTCRTHTKRETSTLWLVGANHFPGADADPHTKDQFSGSINRQRRMEGLVHALYRSPEMVRLPESLIAILADEEIEGRDENHGTAYANAACPSTGEIWYTFGGYPAASQGRWAKLDWPW